MSAIKRFATSIVRHEFGTAVEVVAEILMTRGSQTMAQIEKATTVLGQKEIKTSLIVLVAHGVAKVTSEELTRKRGTESKKRKSTASPRLRVSYELDLEAVRHRASSAWHIQQAQTRFGREGEFVTETFVQHGKLLLGQLMDLCIMRLLLSETGEDVQPEPAVVEATRTKVQAVFDEMRLNGYIKPADVIGAAVRPSKRARLDEEEDDFEREEEQPDLTNMESTFWSLDATRFLVDYRNQDIVDFVRRKLNPMASTLVHLMLKEYPLSSSDPCPLPVPMHRFASLAEQADTPMDLSEGELRRYLEQLTGPACTVYIKQSDGYVLNHRELITQLKSSHAQSVVTGKFDQLAGRIFSLLLVKKRLEEKQVVTLATAPNQKVRAALYAMMKAGFASLQEVPKGIDRQPSRAFFLWGVPVQQVQENLLDGFLAAWANVRARLAHANLRIKPILDKLDLQEVLTEVEREMLAKWRKADDKLQLSLLHLDKLIMLFRDY